MSKLEQAARQAFETWWEREGQEFLYALNTTTDDDIKLVAEVAWKNGAYCAEQAEQEPVAWVWLDEWLNDGYPEDCFSRVNHQNKTPLYAAPVRTKDLTKEEIQNAMMPIEPTGKDYFLRLARAVIAAYKEKQNELVG